jgi:hypothetical protein
MVVSGRTDFGWKKPAVPLSGQCGVNLMARDVYRNYNRYRRKRLERDHLGAVAALVPGCKGFDQLAPSL